MAYLALFVAVLYSAYLVRRMIKTKHMADEVTKHIEAWNRRADTP